MATPFRSSGGPNLIWTGTMVRKAMVLQTLGSTFKELDFNPGGIMHTHVGLWIDHRQAIIVRVNDDKAETETIISNLEKHVRTAGGSRSRTIWGPQDIVAEDRRDRHFGHHLHQYYEKVVQALHDAPLVYIMGPGEAKMEFKNILESVNPVIRPVTELETCDKLTLNQIVAKVKDHYMISSNRTY